MTERELHGAATGNGAPLPEVQQIAVEYLRKGFSLYECAPKLGVSYQTAYGWMQRYPEFGLACAEAVAEYQERLLKPINALIDRHDEEEFVVPAARMGLDVLRRRYRGWQDRAVVEQDVQVAGTVQHEVSVADWSTPERVRAVVGIYRELGLAELADEQPVLEPPATTAVVQQRNDPAAALPATDGDCEDGVHVGRLENRRFCARCDLYSSQPFPLALEPAPPAGG
jgi:hypothetical protein